MKQHAVSTAEHLDAKLTLHAMRKREQLRRIAEGRFGWRLSVILLPPVLLIAIGLTQLTREERLAEVMRETSGAVYVVLGVTLLVSFLWSYTQRQLNALLELVKRLEQDRL